MEQKSHSTDVQSGDERKGPCADECCSIATHNLSDQDIELDVRVFSALSNETRYEALRLLSAADEEICACELVPQFDVKQSTISKALSALHQADLVDRRKDGRWRYYTTTVRAEKLLTAIDTTREEIL
jgi:ArsR family transcriptional regulator